MIRRLVIFLIRKKLKVKNYEDFRFTNQKNKRESYYFNGIELVKNTTYGPMLSNVRLNYLLSDECHVEKV